MFYKLREWFEVLPKDSYITLYASGHISCCCGLESLLTDNRLDDKELNSNVCNIQIRHKYVYIDTDYVKAAEYPSKEWRIAYENEENSCKLEKLYIEQAKKSGKYVESTLALKIDLEKECKKYVYVRHDLPETIKEHKIKSLYWFRHSKCIYDDCGNIVMNNILESFQFNEFCVAFDKAVVLLCDGLKV